jgi:hypothetical protein
VKFVPRRSQIIGRMVIKRVSSMIVRVDESKVTKFILVDAVGEEAAANGIKVGDLVVPNALGNIVMNEGFRPVLEEKAVAFFVTDVPMSELAVQTDSGNKYVPFDAPDAAKPLGAQPQSSSEAA